MASEDRATSTQVLLPQRLLLRHCGGSMMFTWAGLCLSNMVLPSTFTTHCPWTELRDTFCYPNSRIRSRMKSIVSLSLSAAFQSFW